MGTVYLIHFAEKYHHAQHYLGWTGLPLEERIKRHRAGNGARLLQVITEAGIDWQVVRTWEDVPMGWEQQLKRQKNTPRFCPVCRQAQEEAMNHDVASVVEEG